MKKSWTHKRETTWAAHVHSYSLENLKTEAMNVSNTDSHKSAFQCKWYGQNGENQDSDAKQVNDNKALVWIKELNKLIRA